MNKSYALTICSKIAPSIIVDMDDVLCELSPLLHEGLLKETGQDIPINEWEHYQLPNLYQNITSQLISDIIIKYDVYARSSPIAGAVRALECFRERGYIIHLCTARGMIEGHEQVTKQWIAQHNVPHDSLTFVQFGESKSQAYGQLDKVFSYMFDDAIHNIDDAIGSNKVIKPTIVTRPWNKNERRYLRTPSLFDFCKDVGWV